MTEELQLQTAMLLKRDLIETKGFVDRAAYRTGISRKKAYVLINYWGLWPVVNKARRQRVEKTKIDGSNLLQRTQISMRG